MLELFKLTAITAVLIYASCYDVLHHEVRKEVYILITMLGLVSLSRASLLGALMQFVPLYIVALCCSTGNSQAIGGGDIKLATCVGFALGIPSFFGLLLGLILACVLVPIIKKIRKEKLNTPFALVPYMTSGYLTIIFLNLIEMR